jgi:hypothetical protein
MSLNEKSWQLRKAMLEAFFTFSPQQRDIEEPHSLRHLYEDQIYGNWYDEWEVGEVAENLEINWTEHPPSYPWQTLIRQSPQEPVEFIEYWSSECFEGLKTKARYACFMEGVPADWDLESIVKQFDKDMKELGRYMGFDFLGSEVKKVPYSQDFVTISYLWEIE